MKQDAYGPGFIRAGLADNGAKLCRRTNPDLTCYLLMAGYEPGGDKGRGWTKIMASNVTVIGGGSVMVWAGIHHDGKTDLVRVPGNLTAQRHCDGIIEPVVVPYLQQHNIGISQHDNARPHTARHTQNILRIHNVSVLQWPA